MYAVHYFTYTLRYKLQSNITYIMLYIVHCTPLFYKVLTTYVQLTYTVQRHTVHCTKYIVQRTRCTHISQITHITLPHGTSHNRLPRTIVDPWPIVVLLQVRDWLALTFTRSMSNMKRRRNQKPKFRSVAQAIRAGIMVDKLVGELDTKNIYYEVLLIKYFYSTPIG